VRFVGVKSLALIVSEISAFNLTDGQTELAMYTLWGWKRFLLPFTYFPTNLVYPFKPRVTGINTKNDIPNSIK